MRHIRVIDVQSLATVDQVLSGLLAALTELAEVSDDLQSKEDAVVLKANIDIAKRYYERFERLVLDHQRANTVPASLNPQIRSSYQEPKAKDNEPAFKTQAQRDRARSNSTWVTRCINNVLKFVDDFPTLTTKDHLEFVREQYQILKVLIKVADGTAHFRGVTTFTTKR